MSHSVKGLITEVNHKDFIAQVYEFPNAKPEIVLFKMWGSSAGKVKQDARGYCRDQKEVLIDFNIYGNKNSNPSLRCWAIWQVGDHK